MVSGPGGGKWAGSAGGVNHNAFLNRPELEIVRAGLERVRGVVTV